MTFENSGIGKECYGVAGFYLLAQYKYETFMPLYVGRTNCLWTRLRSHFIDKRFQGIIDYVQTWDWSMGHVFEKPLTYLDAERHMQYYESILIYIHDPIHNKKHGDVWWKKSLNYWPLHIQAIFTDALTAKLFGDKDTIRIGGQDVHRNSTIRQSRISPALCSHTRTTQSSARTL